MDKKQVGMIGLGRMGGNIVSRLVNECEVIVWNRSKEPVQKAVALGAKEAPDVQALVAQLQKPRIVWQMLPSGQVTEDMFQTLLTLLEPGDVIIEGANSQFHDTQRRHQLAQEKQIHMIDVGVSGGILAKDSGYPLMAGGSPQAYKLVEPIFAACSRPGAYDLVGPAGAGHYVKMVHNAIEYGMMQAIAEGFDLLKEGSYDLDLVRVAKLWNHGTIVSSLLMEVTQKALEQNIQSVAPFVQDSGEGKWAAVEAMEHSVPFVVNTYALHARYLSRQQDSFAFKLLAGMRQQFGGHAIKQKD
ncbi:MAG: phosphogluconate dehydrogenase (NAD(+)-dependent, decarboxylating) [Candidatus Woesearchaeota archaeon]